MHVQRLSYIYMAIQIKNKKSTLGSQLEILAAIFLTNSTAEYTSDRGSLL